jgi:branched-chain amino acid transport system permease protein
MRILVIFVAFLLMALLTVMVKKTKVGKAMRATAQDIEAAAFMGIDTDRIIVLVFLIGSALGGAAGALVGLLFTQVDYYVGFQAGLKGFTAAGLGGIGNIFGAMLEASSSVFSNPWPPPSSPQPTRMSLPSSCSFLCSSSGPGA